MRAVTALMIGTVGILASTKPSHQNFRETVTAFQQRLMDESMKKTNDGGMAFALFGGVVKDIAGKSLDMRCTTYDYVVCKIGVISFNTVKNNKPQRETLYTWGVFNKWTIGDQSIMKFITECNEKMFRRTLMKIPLE